MPRTIKPDGSPMRDCTSHRKVLPNGKPVRCRSCHKCEGKGYYLQTTIHPGRYFKDTILKWYVCQNCNGRGMIRKGPKKWRVIR